MRIAELLAEKGNPMATDFLKNVEKHDAELRIRRDRVKAGLGDLRRRLSKIKDRKSKQYAQLAAVLAQREQQVRGLNAQIYEA